MSAERDRDLERRLHEAALAKALGRPPDELEEPEPDDDSDAPDRWEHQALWVDHQIRVAMARGEFDNLPGAGKPLRLPDRHDPDWWVKGLIEREKITGVLPPALALRKEDAELEAALDREATEDEVRRAVEDFNKRVVDARRQLLGGPPVVTPTRDVEAEVEAWRARRAARRAARARAAQQVDSPPSPGRRRWWHRRRDA